MAKILCDVPDADDEEIEQNSKMCASHFWGLTWCKKLKVCMVFVGLETFGTSSLEIVPCRFLGVIPVERNNWIMEVTLSSLLREC